MRLDCFRLWRSNSFNAKQVLCSNRVIAQQSLIFASNLPIAGAIPMKSHGQPLIRLWLKGHRLQEQRILFEHTVVAFDDAVLTVEDSSGDTIRFRPQFVLDASGFGRVLPRLLNLEVPSNFPERTALFTHVRGDQRDDSVDLEQILISIHPEKS